MIGKNHCLEMTARRHQPPCRHRAAGFTLVEVLVVLTIIGIIGAVLIMRVSSTARADAMEMEAKSFIMTIDAALEEYKNHPKFGVLPATSLENVPGVGRLQNRINMGIESLVLALNSKKFDGTRVFEGGREEAYENLDGDSTAKPMSYLSTSELLEVVDPWDNPYAYFNAEDYERTDVRKYKVLAQDGDEHEIVTVKPHVNPKTRSFFNMSTYQLFSAGPDGVFNTEDDIGNW